jgi:hypothetical protein
MNLPVDTTTIALDANEVWRVLKAFEQALEVLHADLDEEYKGDPALDPVYRGYLDLYERFKAMADLLPEPDVDHVADDL